MFDGMTGGGFPPCCPSLYKVTPVKRDERTKEPSVQCPRTEGFLLAASCASAIAAAAQRT